MSDSSHATELTDRDNGAGAVPFLIRLYHSVLETGTRSKTEEIFRSRFVTNDCGTAEFAEIAAANGATKLLGWCFF